MDDLYQEIILEEFQHPKNKGEFTDQSSILTIKKTNVGCGDEFAVSLRLDSDSLVVTDVRWLGQGCAISTSAMSLLSEFVKGKPVEEIQSLTKEDMLELIGLTEITPTREKCLLLSLKAVKGALDVNR